ncbi:hypothetical protein C8R47DRAFT_1064384 [Mycena vitilis]|nr:hypothetical protein C8R47DRAFT_1064384 [Mycena vitilis]
MPAELWSKTFKMSLVDPMKDGKAHANGRAVLCAVSRCIRTLVHTDCTFWTAIHLDLLVYPSALKFVLTRIPSSARVHVKITLGELPYVECGDPPSVLYPRLQTLLSLLGPISCRWESFHLNTEHPALFQFIRGFCASLEAPSLRSLHLYYQYMHGYSDFDAPSSDSYRFPLRAAPWFLNQFSNLNSLSLVATPLHWGLPGLFESLTEVDLGDLEPECKLDFPVLQSMFERASELRVFRLGDTPPFPIPPNKVLASSSLVLFDISLPTGDLGQHFHDLLCCLRFPRLRSLIARRTAWDDMTPLLLCNFLPTVVELELRGDCRSRDGISVLLDRMRSIRTLDLARTSGAAFVSFLEWSVTRFIAADSDLPLIPLRTLCVGHERPEDLLAVVAIYTVSTCGTLHTLFAERPSSSSIFMDFIAAVVPDCLNLFPWLYALPLIRQKPPDRCWCIARFQAVATDHAELMRARLLITRPSGLVKPRSTMETSPSVLRWCAHTSAPSPKSHEMDIAARPMPAAIIPYKNVSLIYVQPTFPWEIVLLVFDACVEHEDWDKISDFLLSRTTIKLLSKSCLEYVNRYPIFWDHILLTPDSLPTINDAVAAAGSLPIHLTVRLPTPDTPFGVHWLHNSNVSTSYIVSAARAMRGFVPRCAGITVEAPSRYKAERLLHLVRDATPSVLGYLAVSFELPTLLQFTSNISTFSGFDADPPFGPMFYRHLELSIRPTTRAKSHCSQVHTTTTSSSLYQSSGDDLEWSDFVKLVDSAGTYTRLVLDSVVFVDSPAYIRVSPPLFSITVLSLSFAGNSTMARMLACINLPNLNALVVHIATMADCVCLSFCGVLMSVVSTLKIVTPSSVGGLPWVGGDSTAYTVFSMLHAVDRIDLRHASPAWLAYLFHASSLVLDAHTYSAGVNWNACPTLTHLDLDLIGPDQLKRLLSTHQLSGYGDTGRDVVAWLRSLLWISRSLPRQQGCILLATGDQLSVDETLHSLLSFLPHCKQLSVEAADIVPLTTFTGMMSAIPMPRLRYLALVSEPVNSMAAMATSYLPNYLAVAVSHGSGFIPTGRGPSFIRLSGLVLTWTHHIYYANVTTLVLQYFSKAVAPDIVQLHTLLASALMLRRLSVNGLCCNASSVALTDLKMLCLEEFQLRMAGNETVGRLVSSIVAPKLRNFHVFLDGPPDLSVLVGCTSLLERVDYLVVDGDRCEQRSIVELFSLMPGVLHCDMSMSSSMFFGALRSGGRSVFPLLRSLVLSDMRFQELKEFVDSRNSTKPVLDALSVRYMFDCGLDTKQLGWIKDRVGILNVDPAWQKYWYHLK